MTGFEGCHRTRDSADPTAPRNDTEHREPADNSNTILKKALRYTAANDTELFDHVRDLYVEVGDNHLQVFFMISWLLHPVRADLKGHSDESSRRAGLG